MTDRIELRGMKVAANHGVFDFERENGQEFIVDLTVWADLRPAVLSDELADTLDYGALAQICHDIVGGEPCNLIEAVSGRLADSILGSDQRIQAVEVKVHKPSAPIPVHFTDVAVVARRSRKQFATKGRG